MEKLEPSPSGASEQGAYHNIYISAEDSPQSYGWWRDMQRNKPQSNAMFAASFIFISGGMSLSSSLIFPGSIHMNMHMRICWFIAVIIGACLAVAIFNRITWRLSNILASVLVIINGILILLGNRDTLIAARYCDGIAFGMTLIPAIVIGAEQSVKRFRGIVLRIEQGSLIAGMTIYFWFCIHAMRIHGSFAVVYGVAALGSTFMYTLESPITHLRKGNEAKAIHTLSLLQKPGIVTNETHDLLNENQHLLDEDTARGRASNLLNGLAPLVKLCLFRALVTMSFSTPIICASVSGCEHGIKMPYIFPSMRLIGVIFTIFTLDTLGRRTISATCLLASGGLLLGLLCNKELNIPILIMIAYQVLSGLTAPASTCYLGEAFSISVKPYFILLAVLLENILQIILISTGIATSGEKLLRFLFILSALQIVFGIYSFFGMPETKQTTLREALRKFNNS